MVAETLSRSEAKARTRERLLNAAEQVLAETDLADASVERILQQAGVSRRTFYQHFPNKEGLAVGLMERAIAGLLERAGDLREAPAAVPEKVAITVQLYFSLWQKHGRVMYAITRESLRSGSPLCAQRETALRQVCGFIRQALAGEGIRVSGERAAFAALGAEALLMRAVEQRRPLDARLRGELVASVQRLLV